MPGTTGTTASFQGLSAYRLEFQLAAQVSAVFFQGKELEDEEAEEVSVQTEISGKCFLSEPRAKTSSLRWTDGSQDFCTA